MLMKKMLALVCLILCRVILIAQPGHTNYNAGWKTVDSLINKKGLTASALQKVNVLYSAAKKENNDAQTIRALIYRLSLQDQLKENIASKNMQELEQEIADAKQPARSILINILAQTYLDYFRMHRWQIYDRTKTINFKKKDIATWDAEDFQKKISELFLSSLEEKKLLYQTSLESLDPIILKGNVRYLRPTLFDLLAHQALDYFKGDETNNRPSYAFEMNDPIVFADAPVFVAHPFRSDDSLSLHVKALQLFQQVTLQHFQDARPDALLDLDVERLQFVRQYAVMDDKDSLFMKALAVITDRFGEIPIAAEAWYLQAQQYASLAAKYDPLGDTANRYAYTRAVTICEKVIKQKDSSEGNSNCQNLLKNILHKQLILETERINSPGQPFRNLLSWRNFSRVHFRLIRIDHSLYESLGDNSWEDARWKKLLQLPVFRAFSQTLPETGDYQLHRTEIKIDSLPIGKYALVASADEDFGLGRNVLAVQYIYVSAIAYVNYDRDYFVVNRESGQPLAGATVQAWLRIPDRPGGQHQLSNIGVYKTDKRGHFLLSKTGFTHDDRTQLLEISTAGDHLFLDEPLNENYYHEEDSEDDTNAVTRTKYEKNNLNSFLFTDRAIYRPGQTIYFKGIVTTRDFHSKLPRILPQFRTKVILYNANSEKIDSLELTTNEYGSYHGRFLLPEHLLNGGFRIDDDSTDGQKDFRVEEYKRPKFYVDYETLKSSYRLGDSIHVTGNARAYAGNNVDGASVKYRVVRQTRFPYPWLFRGRRNYNSQEQEMAHGETHTRSDGSFSIDFAALADRSVDKMQNPVFDYTVSADITDINGETRSAITVVRVGYSALQLSIDLLPGGHLPADSLKEILVNSTNLAGEPEPVSVHVSIYALKPPDRLIRERYWTEPDQFLMNRQEYLASFPHDEYSNETHQANWERTGKVFESTDSANKKEKISLPPGWYFVEAKATDRYGQEVTYQSNFDLYDGRTGQPAGMQYNWVVDEDQTLEPGNTATIKMGSSATDLFVIRQVNKPPANAVKYFSPDKGKYSAGFPVTEADRGGFRVSDAFIKDNRIFTQTHTVQVPWSNKDLNIHYTSFRDKTLPGSPEKWALNISGNKGDKIDAEVLSGMYDGSLDQFSMQTWTIPDLYPVNQGEIDWSGTTNFSDVQSQERYVADEVTAYFEKIYDRFLQSPTDSYIRSGNMFLHAPKMKFARGDTKIEFNRPVEQDGAFGLVATTFGDNGSKPLRRDAALAEVGYFTDSAKVAGNGKQALGNKTAIPNQASVQLRKNFAETAFFLPDLRTDSAGNISFSFTMPEALTRWKWMTLAHTKDLAFGYSEKSVVTQKQLMVQPNAPRFLREGDRMELSVKIVNLTDSEMTGQAELQLTDPTTSQSADGWFSNRQANQFFTVAAKQSVSVSFPIEIPFQYNRPISYRVMASARNYSDGEEATLPVVSNRMLVTESLPLNMPGNGERSFKFEKLLQSGSSETLSQHALTVEFTSNPTWYAVQALPYLMEYPYECAEQTFDRFYANALATLIVNSSPRIRAIFEKWKTLDTAALLSNLEKNPELKSVLLEETPWVLEAKSESAQKKNIALLFDMVHMSDELGAAIGKLSDMQSPDGGFPWFKGGPADLYITQYILTGIGRLQKLDALPAAVAGKLKAMVDAALQYADLEIKRSYDEQRRNNKNGFLSQYPGKLQVQYLYMRSFFSDHGISGVIFPAVNAYRKQAQQSWLHVNNYLQGMIALALYRTGDVQTGKDIMASLRQNAIQDERLGMYWKAMPFSYYWGQSPVETQSLLIEAFREIAPDVAVDKNLKTWLLRQKQTRNWSNTISTADACYALLLGGSDWLSQEREISIRLGDKTVSSSQKEGGEAGTGYFKEIFDGPFINPSMGNITVTMRDGAHAASTSNQHRPVRDTTGSPAWGAVYWQYFEDLDKIVPPAGRAEPLRLSKKLFVERNTDRGPVLDPVSANGSLKPGDKVKIRIELRVDQDLEYVHMKDMRAACMEPVNVLSEYKWQGGLGYYESTKDASTDFFFSSLPRGTYVFEYPVFVGQNGNFSNGVTSIECMYAPEYSFHSEGIRVNVETLGP